MKRTAIIIIAAAVGFAVATALAAAMVGPRRSEPPARRAVASTVDARLANALGAFRRSESSHDALPGPAGQRLASVSALGTNVALARRARTGPDGLGYFLVAGQNSIALVNEDGTGSIDDIDHALSGQAVGFQDCAAGGTKVRVVGLMPDAATNVVVRLANGTQQAVDVVGNVYVVLLDRAAETLPIMLEFDLDGAHRTAPVPVPGDILSTRCASAADLADR